MSDPENFLSRWSRRKKEVAREEAAPAEPERAADDTVAGRRPDEVLAEKAGEQPQPQAGKKTDEPAFDLSKLPSIESITAATDIRPFMAAGVPVALRQAALRRVWVADPKIRDFIEMAENQWDFTGASEVAGFDFSPPTGDVKRMVAELLGERRQTEPESVDRSVTSAAEAHEVPVEDFNQLPVSSGDGASAETAGVVAPNNSLRLNHDAQIEHDVPIEGAASNDVAAQNNDTPQEEPRKISRRSHGGAVPK
jgi:hypothetical protein